MKAFTLIRNNDKFALRRKSETLDENSFTYTESGNNITITAYTGSDTDVKITDKIDEYFSLVRPNT